LTVITILSLPKDILCRGDKQPLPISKQSTIEAMPKYFLRKYVAEADN